MTGGRAVSDPAVDSNGLRAVLDRLEQGTEALASALRQEAAALGDRDPQALLAAVDGKRAALRDLEALTRDPRLPVLLDPARSPWSERAADLAGRLAQCEAGNAANGSVLVGARRDNVLLLRLLGHAPESTVYGTRGQTASPAPSRTLGTA